MKTTVACYRLAAALAVVLTVFAIPGGAQTIRFIDTDPQQVGLAAAEDLGLPAALWTGSTRESLAAAYDGLAGPAATLAIHAALVDLLTVSVPPPSGSALSPPLIARRVAALQRLGATDTAIELAERAPGRFRSHPTLLAAEADAKLLRFDLSGACDLLPLAGTEAATADWQRLRAACRQIHGQSVEAIVAAIMAGRLSAAPDDTFGALMLALQYPQRPNPGGVLPEAPLHFALFRFLRLPLDDSRRLFALPPTIQASLAQTPALPGNLRLAAAEAAVAANTMPAEPLVQLYLQTTLPSSLGSAYRQAAFSGSAAERRRALSELWSKAREKGLLAPIAPMTLGILSRLETTGSPPGFPREALRAALLSGEQEVVTRWRQAMAAGTASPQAQRELEASMALLALAGEPVPPTADWWSSWLAAAKPTEAQQLLVGGALGALGQSFPLAPSPKITRTSTTAPALDAAQRAPGEAAFHALTALAEEPDADVALQVLTIQSVARIHPGHARALALELAIAAGL